MMPYILLLMVVLFVWAMSFIVSGYELMSPVSLALLGVCVSVTLSIVGFTTWNQVALGWEGFTVVAVGSISLLAGTLLAERLVGGKVARLARTEGEGDYKAGAWKYALVLAVLVLAVCVRVAETYQMAVEMGADVSTYSSAATAVRNSMSSIHSSAGVRVGVGFSLLERQLEKVSVVSGYVAVYLIVKSLMSKDWIRSVLSGAILAMSCLFCLSSGARTTILYYVVALVVVYAVLALHAGRKSKELSVRLLAGCSVIAVIGAIFFYLASSLVGRRASSGIVEYISFYYGCGTPALQHILDTGGLPQLAPGVRSFYYLFSVPYKLGMISDYPSYSIAWVDMGGHGCNIFTGFARYFFDFGIAGVIILSALAAMFMTLLYRFARSTGWPALVVLTGYLGAYAFDFAREEFVFSRLLSPTQLVSVSIMLLITLFLKTSLREDVGWIKAKIALACGGKTS